MLERTPMRPAILAACGVIAGMAAHVVWSERVSPRAASAVAWSTTAALSACKPDAEQMRIEVRCAVREAVRGDAPSPLVDALGSGVFVAPPPGEETADNRQARDEQTALVDGAIHAGRWTDDDVTKFRAILARLSAGDRPTALTEVSQAIDEHRFKVEAAVPF
jgi:hypothetical protein